MRLLSLSDKRCSSVAGSRLRFGQIRLRVTEEDFAEKNTALRKFGQFYFILFFCHLLNTNTNARSHCVWCLSAPLNLQFLYLILLNTVFIIHTHTTPCECSLWLSFTLIDSIYSFNAHSSHLAVDTLFTVKILSRFSVFLNVECFFLNSKWILVFIGYNSAFCLHALLLIFNKFAFPQPNCASV